MCDTVTCKRNHKYCSKFGNNDLVISKTEFTFIVACLSTERKHICSSCGKCEECKRTLQIIHKFQKIEGRLGKRLIVILNF